jgi:hypothetical protein
MINAWHHQRRALAQTIALTINFAMALPKRVLIPTPPVATTPKTVSVAKAANRVAPAILAMSVSSAGRARSTTNANNVVLVVFVLATLVCLRRRVQRKQIVTATVCIATWLPTSVSVPVNAAPRPIASVKHPPHIAT